MAFIFLLSMLKLTMFAITVMATGISDIYAKAVNRNIVYIKQLSRRSAA
jgi:hypothetical protein